MTSILTVVVTLVLAASIAGQAFAETVRNILPPFYITDPGNCYSTAPTSCFTYDFATANDRFYLSPVYQIANWPSQPYVSPVQYTTSYNAQPNTGLGPLDQSLQRGPLVGNVAQSTFQLTGYQGGMLMRSWDSPYMPQNGYPGCPGGNCAGAIKHTAYQYIWSSPKTIFKQTTNPVDQNDGLVLQANVTVNQFEAWSTVTGGLPAAPVIGQYTFVAYLHDPSGKTLQYVIYLYSSPCVIASPPCPSGYATYDGSEGVGEEVIGSTQSPYIITSFKTNRLMTYSTIRSDSSGVFSNSTWPGSSPFFRVYITPYNLQNAIYTLNNPPYNMGLSTDVLHYTVAEVAMNQEVPYSSGDAWVMGSSFNAFGVFEITP
jgi:hypothetical protein